MIVSQCFHVATVLLGLGLKLKRFAKKYKRFVKSLQAKIRVKRANNFIPAVSWL